VSADRNRQPCCRPGSPGIPTPIPSHHQPREHSGRPALARWHGITTALTKTLRSTPFAVDLTPSSFISSSGMPDRPAAPNPLSTIIRSCDKKPRLPSCSRFLDRHGRIWSPPRNFPAPPPPTGHLGQAMAKFITIPFVVLDYESTLAGIDGRGILESSGPPGLRVTTMAGTRCMSIPRRHSPHAGLVPEPAA